MVLRKLRLWLTSTCSIAVASLISKTGRVKKWSRTKSPNSRTHRSINGIGLLPNCGRFPTKKEPLGPCSWAGGICVEVSMKERGAQWFAEHGPFFTSTVTEGDL